MPKVNSL